MNSQQKGDGKPGSKSKMKRSLGTMSVFAICTGAMFSSGFFLLPGLAASESGPSLPLVYLVASLLMLPAIFSMAELSSAIPRSGGPYLFLNRSLGPLFGMIGAFGKYLQMVLKAAFAFVGVGIYLSLLIDVPMQPIAIGLIVLFTFLNLIGAKQTASTEIVLVTFLLILLTYFLLAGVTQVATESISFREHFQPIFPFGYEGFISAVALVFVSFGGIGQVASVSEEVKKPSQSMPKGMLLALGVSVFFYLVGTSVMVLLIPSESLQGDNTPVATAAEQFVQLPIPTLVVVIAALAGFASAGNAAIFAATRYPLALARDRLIWSKFGYIDKKGVPKISVIFTAVILVLLVLAFDVKGIAKLASAFLLFVFMGMCIAVMVFRKSKVKEYKPGFYAPLYPWAQIFGAIVYLYLIIESGLQAIGFIGGVSVLAILWYRFGVRQHASQSAAIYQLFGRLAQKSSKTLIGGETGFPMLGGTNLAHLTERAIVLDMDEKATLEEVIQKVAHALEGHLGGEKQVIARRLQKEVSHWKSPLRSNVLISPALLQGIEQPELVIIRGSIHIDDHSYEGLIVLVDDEESADRLLRLLSQLEGVIYHSDFPGIWRNAKGTKELKEALKHDIRTVQTFTIEVEESGPTASLKGKRMKDIDLPEGSLVALVQREGETRVPNGKTTFHAGDRITLVANSKAMDKIRHQFNEEDKEARG